MNIWRHYFRGFIAAALLSVSSHGLALVILQYQNFDLAQNSTSVTTEMLAAHLGFIEDNNLNVISLIELDKLLQENKAMPDKTVILTFDLGTRSFYQKALPLLKKHGFPFAVFVSPSLQDKQQAEVMSWQQLREVVQAGGIIGNRGYSGEHLIRKQGNENLAQWQARVLADITSAQHRISEETAQQGKFFAYPFGEYSKDLESLLAKEGYTRFGSHPGPSVNYPGNQVFPRFCFGANNGGEQDFSAKVLSLPLSFVQVAVLTENKVPLTEPELPMEVTRPILKLYLEAPLAKLLVCFANGQGGTEKKLDQFGVSIQAKKSLRPGGRNFYHCTAPSGDPARSLWYSQFFISRQTDGSWYSEAP